MIRERVEPHNLSSLCLGLRRSISISLKSVDRSAFLISLGGEDGRIKMLFHFGPAVLLLLLDDVLTPTAGKQITITILRVRRRRRRPSVVFQ